jgi:transposase
MDVKVKRGLNDREVAERWGVGLQTIRNWRGRGQGPPYIKAHRRVIYDADAVDRWFTARQIDRVA